MTRAASSEPATSSEPAVSSEEEAPPIFGSWNRLYELVLGSLAVTVTLLYALSKVYS